MSNSPTATTASTSVEHFASNEGDAGSLQNEEEAPGSPPVVEAMFTTASPSAKLSKVRAHSCSNLTTNSFDFS